ncbi:MAG: AAA family ATPase, partial [Betaproteobacteria bacterium]|nr:AAA family ATPase [Betaproteobacteria bacterium]
MLARIAAPGATPRRTAHSFVRLLLHAFGPFTDKTIDSCGAPGQPGDLHLIYGPNEAGKSSALRAIT